MKAIVQNSYGSIEALSLKEVDQPEVKENEVLVRIQTASLNAGDVFTLKGSPYMIRFSVGFPKPKDHILGWDLAGTVQTVGESVSRFKPGDEVFGSCSGTLAEFASASEEALALKPAKMTFEAAAAVPTAALTALIGLRDVGKIQAGQKVLINGASGGVGTFAVQIAKAYGAEVTGVCSTRNVELVRSLGADHVVDYKRKDFTRGGRCYDLILDNVASCSFSDLRRVIEPDGLIVPNSGHGGMGYVIKAFALSPFMPQLGRMFLANPNQKDMAVLKDFIEQGKVKAVVDRLFSLDEAPQAFQFMEEQHPQGKIVITME